MFNIKTEESFIKKSAIASMILSFLFLFSSFSAYKLNAQQNKQINHIGQREVRVHADMRLVLSLK